MKFEQREKVDAAIAMQKLVGEVLYWAWDPIGVNYTFDTRDEYDNYELPVVSILREDLDPEAKQSKVATYLDKLCRDDLGVGSRPDLCRQVAERLMDLVD